MRTELEAHAGAAKLLARMKGRLWRSRVWENLGWHYEVENGHVSVSPTNTSGDFIAMLMPHYSYYGRVPHGTDPNKLADEVVKLIETHAQAAITEATQARKSLVS